MASEQLATVVLDISTTMARKLRIEFPGACYHVINRGNYRRILFSLPGAAAAFERVLFEACARFGWILHAFIVMRNHFHLGLETREPNLSLGMKWLQGTWSARFNRFHGEVGRPFQGRYKAIHVDPGHALAQVAHYIHLNPVRASILPADRVAEFRWSSLWHFPRPDRPAFLDPAIVLRESGGLADSQGGWKSYAGYLELLAEEDPKRRDELYGPLNKGWCIGSPDFRATLQMRLATEVSLPDGISLLGADQAALQKDRESHWEKCLQAAVEELELDIESLPKLKSSLEKVRLASVIKSRTSASNRWLAERLQMGRPASASQFIRRFRIANSDLAHRDQLALSNVKI